MCPGTLALIAVGASAAGSVLKGVSAAESAGYQAQVARNNAIVQAQNASHAAQATAADTEAEGLKQRANNAEYRAGQGALGIDVNSGSLADVQMGNRELGQLDTATVANRGAEQVYGYQTQATNEAAQATLYQSQVGPDIAGGILGAVGDIAGGAPNLPSTFAWMGTPGTGGGTVDDAEFGGSGGGSVDAAAAS